MLNHNLGKRIVNTQSYKTTSIHSAYADQTTPKANARYLKLHVHVSIATTVQLNTAVMKSMREQTDKTHTHRHNDYSKSLLTLRLIDTILKAVATTQYSPHLLLNPVSFHRDLQEL